VPAAGNAVGKRFPAHLYAVGREKIREYARAVGETDPRHLDLEAARAAGHPDLVAPPMFAVVYCAEAIEEALFDPEIGIDFAMLLHGGQEFRWGPLVHAGDEIATEVEFGERTERIGLAFYRFSSRSVNQRGDEVCSGEWTHVVRPAEQ
jgi:acyl dehydratase